MELPLAVATESSTPAALGSRRRKARHDGIYIHPAPLAIEAHAPVNQSKDCVIATKPDVSSRQEFCAALTHNDVAGHNRLAAEFFHTQPFADAVTAILNAALSFFMSHRKIKS